MVVVQVSAQREECTAWHSCDRETQVLELIENSVQHLKRTQQIGISVCTVHLSIQTPSVSTQFKLRECVLRLVWLKLVLMLPVIQFSVSQLEGRPATVLLCRCVCELEADGAASL